jgi:hypothetical protein
MFAVGTMNQQINEFYRELDLKPGADLSSVRQSYRQLVKVWHPDRFGHDAKLQTVANDRLRRINCAYEKLLAYFDDAGKAQTSVPPKAETPKPPPGADWLEEVLKMSSVNSPKRGRPPPGTDIYQAGLNRHRARDYKGALDLYIQSAELGNASAQYGVGFIYYTRRNFVPLFGANKHFAEILRWWTKAAEQGHADAQYMVGIFHQLGWCTPFDEAEARKWFQCAVAQDHLGAKERLKKLGVLNKINAVPVVNLFLGDTPPKAPPPK